MRRQRLTLIATASVFLSACSNGPGLPQGDCANFVDVGDIRLIELSVPELKGSSLTTGGRVVPSRHICAAPRQLYRLRGVPPTLALSSTKQISGKLYVAQGSLMLAPANPLRSIFRTYASSGSGLGCRSQRIRTRTAVAAITPLGLELATVERPMRTYRVTRATRYSGFHGLPRLVKGDRIELIARHCLSRFEIVRVSRING